MAPAVTIQECGEIRRGRDSLKKVAFVLLGFALSAALVAGKWGWGNSVTLARSEERIEVNQRDIRSLEAKVGVIILEIRRTIQEEFKKDRGEK